MRTEQDALGSKQLADDVYYGIQTLRAVENFPISGLHPHPAFIKATVVIKKAAALVNSRLGHLDASKAKVIVEACDEILLGKLQEQFVVDVFQAGAGTSHNMNANEIIANRAIELLGGEKGNYTVIHPNDHVNMAQSTNDVIPTAMRIASLWLIDDLIKSVEEARKAFANKGKEFDNVIKSGRTHLQDAVPIRLGQEFNAYATALDKCSVALEKSCFELHELGLGGTAVGTGLNADPQYRTFVANELAQLTGLTLHPSSDYFEAMQSMASFVEVSGAVRRLAVELTRIANDLRLLASGPRTGFAEIILPAVQPGSSIMPGKVNPSMAEMMNMAAFHVLGNDAAIIFASQAGQLELNVMMPIIAHNLLQAIQVSTNALRAFTNRCVEGIVADKARCNAYAETSVAIAAILNAHIGYSKAALVSKESVETGKLVRDIILEQGILSKEELERALDWNSLTKPGIPGKNKITAQS